MLRIVSIAIVLMSFCGNARAQDARGFGISASVPLICDLTVTPMVPNDQSGTLEGEVREFCNGGQGYDIVATYLPLASKEHVIVNYDGKPITLPKHGRAVLDSRDGPTFRKVPVSIIGARQGREIAISLAASAI